MTDKERRQKARTVYGRLRKLHPEARTELRYGNPLELLVATVLSAQCTDVRVNEVTANLFRKYRKPEDYLKATASELEEDIRPAGFFRQKTRSLRGAMETIIDEHGGRVPGDMDALTRLPGIGRKTANVILGNAFGVPGIAVDTHVSRVSRRIGLTAEKDPVKIESDLNAMFPEKEWTRLSHTLIFHGRYVCKARKPLCERCSITSLCDHFQDEHAGQPVRQ